MSAPADVQGVHRVAALLLSLDPAVAKKVIGHLAPDVVDDVSQAMLTLPASLCGPGALERLRRELALSANRPRAVRRCSETQLSALLTDAIGKDRARKVLESVRERRLQERPFLALESADPYTVGVVLAKESAAVAAVVIAHLEPAFSASVLKAFERDHALEVVRLVATLTPPPYPMLRRIGERLRAAVDATEGAQPAAGAAKRLQTVAELLSNSPPEMERGVLEALRKDSEEVANELREFLFSWDDIGAIDKRSMQKILGAVDTRTIAMALKGSSEDIERNVMSNLSSRVGAMVREERDRAGAVPRAEVLAAREDVMRSVRALIDAGEFRPTRGGDELVE